jgi:hypothetical protein
MRKPSRSTRRPKDALGSSQETLFTQQGNAKARAVVNATRTSRHEKRRRRRVRLTGMANRW